MDYECLRNFLFPLSSREARERETRSSFSICRVSNYTFRKALMIHDERSSIAAICAKKDSLFRRQLYRIRQSIKEFFNYPINERERESDGIKMFFTLAILQNSVLDKEFFNYSDTSKYWK